MIYDRIVHHSGAVQYCALPRVSEDRTDHIPYVTCITCNKLLRLKSGTVYYTVTFLDRVYATEFNDTDIIRFARQVCGVSKQRIEKFLYNPSRKYLHTKGFTLRKHIKTFPM